jgi:uncharacterized membrane protein YoaT (DUF817 family)
MINKKSQRILLFVIIAIILCIAKLSLLVYLFPQTGLSRIFYIPLWIFVYTIIAILLSRQNLDRSGKKVLFTNVIFHVLTFHIMLYSWPQSAAIRKNLIFEFYTMFWK